MKKTVALVLCLVMAAVLAACDSQTTAEESNNTQNTAKTETAAPGTEETEQPGESSEPDETKPVETEPVFDASWAGDEYVMPIPEPPFAYAVNVDRAAVEIRSTNGGMDGDVTHQSILNYCEELKNVGFTLNLTENEIGERYGRICYEFSAYDAAGNNVNLIDDGGGVIIYVSLTKTSGETDPAFDTSWASNEFEAMIPELPFKGWTVSSETDTVYELELGGLRTANGADTATGFEEDKDALITYINSLSAYGFTVEETGENYRWLVTDNEGNTIEFMCADGFCWITFKKAN